MTQAEDDRLGRTGDDRMTDTNRVLWSEGLFLRTQHFQQQDRHTEALVRGAAAGGPAADLRLPRPDARHRPAGRRARSRSPRPAASSRTARPSPFPRRWTPPEPLAITRDTGRRRRAARPAARAARRRELRPRPCRALAARATAAGSSGSATRCRAAPTPRRSRSPDRRPLLLPPGRPVGGYTTLPVAEHHGPARRRRRGAGRRLPAAGAHQRRGALLRPAAAGGGHRPRPHRRGAWPDGARRAGRSVENLLVLELANTARPRLRAHAGAGRVPPGRAVPRARRPRRADGDLRLRARAGWPSCRPTTTSTPAPAFAALTDTLRSLILSLRYVEPKSRALPVMKHATNVWKVRIDSPEHPDGQPDRGARRLGAVRRRAAQDLRQPGDGRRRPTSSRRCGSRACPASR